MTESIRTHVVTGFMDAGKTSFIQELIFRDYFHKREHGKTLVIVFEEGEIGYDEEHLLEFRTEVVYWEGGDIAAFLSDAIRTHQPDRIFVEANCMMEELMEKLKCSLSVNAVTMLIDASTLDLYYLNMLQLLQDMVKSADPVIFNRAEKKAQLEPYSTPFRLMNQRAGFLWESPMGYSEKVFGNALPFDRMQQHICLSEADYPLFYLDALEYPEHYAGKELEMDVQILYEESAQESHAEPLGEEGEREPECKAGRTVMTCCMNDIQFLGFRLGNQKSLPEDKSFVHLTAKASVVFDPYYKRNRLMLTPLSAEKIPVPSQLVLAVRTAGR